MACREPGPERGCMAGLLGRGETYQVEPAFNRGLSKALGKGWGGGHAP